MENVLDTLLLMEILYSKMDNSIPLIKGNGFHVNMTIALSFLYVVLGHSVPEHTDRHQKTHAYRLLKNSWLIKTTSCSAEPHGTVLAARTGNELTDFICWG